MVTKEPIITSLNGKQKEAVLGDLHEKKATFFTYDTLQRWLKTFGPNTKVAELQKALQNQQEKLKQ
jgi:hypothetical protein